MPWMLTCVAGFLGALFEPRIPQRLIPKRQHFSGRQYFFLEASACLSDTLGAPFLLSSKQAKVLVFTALSPVLL